MADIQPMILCGMATDSNIAHKLLPHVKSDFFEDQGDQTIHNMVSKYLERFNRCPPKAALEVGLDQMSLAKDVYDSAQQTLSEMYSDDVRDAIKTGEEWFYETAEKFCVDRSIFLAIKQSVSILEESSDSKDSIPGLLQDALNVSFESSIGHDYIKDSGARLKFYSDKGIHVPTGISVLDQILNGGFLAKSLFVYVAGTGIGKSTVMCSNAATQYMMGKNVLYITLEMAEEMISQRIDANLMDINIGDVSGVSESEFTQNITDIRNKTPGRLIIKEYAPGSASARNFRSLIKDLKMKSNFVPDIVYIDYLGLCASSRVKTFDNMYSHGKMVAEELRGLAIEFNIPVVSATQTNRAGQLDSDFDLTEVSESHGVSMTADYMMGVISTDQLEAQNQVRMKQLKNRYGPVDRPRTFLVGIDRAHMRLFDISSQQPVVGAQSAVSTPTASANNGMTIPARTPGRLAQNVPFGT